MFYARAMTILRGGNRLLGEARDESVSDRENRVYLLLFLSIYLVTLEM